MPMRCIIKHWSTAVYISHNTNLGVDSVEPALIGHVDLEHDIEVALVIWCLVHRHALSTEDDTISRLDNFPSRALDMNPATIQVGDKDAREAKKCL